MKVKVEQDKCISCGACWTICPNVFDVDNETRKSYVKKQPEDTNEEECVKTSIDACPVRCIIKE